MEKPVATGVSQTKGLAPHLLAVDFSPSRAAMKNNLAMALRVPIGSAYRDLYPEKIDSIYEFLEDVMRHPSQLGPQAKILKLKRMPVDMIQMAGILGYVPYTGSGL